jgi:hypothetical protein
MKISMEHLKLTDMTEVAFDAALAEIQEFRKLHGIRQEEQNKQDVRREVDYGVREGKTDSSVAGRVLL